MKWELSTVPKFRCPEATRGRNCAFVHCLGPYVVILSEAKDPGLKYVFAESDERGN